MAVAPNSGDNGSVPDGNVTFGTLLILQKDGTYADTMANAVIDDDAPNSGSTMTGTPFAPAGNHGQYSGLVLMVTTARGSYIPMGTVKQAMSGVTKAPVGTATPFFYPANQMDPQKMVDSWKNWAGAQSEDEMQGNLGRLVGTWAPYGPGDWKRNTLPLGLYDNTANFMYGATSAGFGVPLGSLLFAGDADHGGSNSAVNNASITSGFNAVSSGGSLSLVPYTLAW